MFLSVGLTIYSSSLVVYFSLRVKYLCFMSCMITDISNFIFHNLMELSCVFSRILILSGYICRQIILESLDETDHVRGEEVL